MADISSNEQFEEVEPNDDEVQEDEVYIIDATILDQGEEEDKGQQPISIVGPKAQDVDMIEEKRRIKVVLLFHDENSENP